MLRRCWRNRRALAVIGVLLLGASSARAAYHFERPDPVGSERVEIASVGSPGTSAPDSEQIAAARALAHEPETSVAPRVGQSHPPAEARVPVGWLAPPTRGFLARDGAERSAFRSGCAEIARWCLAHATSTQAP